jgi:hypothetical protein
MLYVVTSGRRHLMSARVVYMLLEAMFKINDFCGSDNGDKPSQPFSSQNCSSTTVEVEVAGSNEQDDQVATDERGQNTQIPPSVVEAVLERRVEFVANLVSAVLAGTGHVVEQVTGSTVGEEIAHVFAAGLALWCLESVVFSRCASDGQVVKFGDYHSTDQAREWVQLVQPDTPELGNLGLGDCDTAEL